MSSDILFQSDIIYKMVQYKAKIQLSLKKILRLLNLLSGKESEKTNVSVIVKSKLIKI